MLFRSIKKCLYSIIGLLPDRAAGIQAKVDKKMDNDNDDNGQWDRDDELEGIMSRTWWDRVVHLSNLSPSCRHV